MASLRHRRSIAEAEDYDDDDGGSGTTAADVATEEEEEGEEDDHRMRLGLHSMTAKGIQHLCSELLEINKASEQGFRANVYLSYLSFIRMFQEAGDLDEDVHQLKRQVIAHRRLIQHLTTNCFHSSSNMTTTMVDDDAGAGDYNYVEEDLDLDVLLSEHRMEQALELLELQGQALRQQATGADDDEAAIVVASSSIRALSARKARVADRFASVAENPRTPRAELLKALSGLCRLGDAERANHLLFRFHHQHLQHRQQRSEGGGGNYIRDLALMVFSSIAQASRGFVALHGRHPSPYTPQLVRWAREEMEDLGAAFSEFVRSSSSMPRAGQSCLALVLEAAECAVSYCASSPPLRDVATEEDVVGLVVAPCIREAVAMYGSHLKEVVRLLVASDAATCWPVLGRFLLPKQLELELELELVQQQQQQQQYCLLTSSGRKFVTLIQEVVEDVAWPLLKLGMMEEVALQLVAELFREYMHSIVELIMKPATMPLPSNSKQQETTATGDAVLDLDVGGDQQYMMWQISILINCTTLVSLFPIIARGISSSSSSAAAAQMRRSRKIRRRQQQEEEAVMDSSSLVSLIKEAAGQVWSCFCQQFIRDTIMSAAAGTPPAAQVQPQGMGSMMPSPAFQAVFQRVRRLKKHEYMMLSGGKDAAAGTGTGTGTRLLQELMEAIIAWLSGNLDSWVVHRAQTQLDVHFLLRMAQLGGFSSDSIRSRAMELLRLRSDEEEDSGSSSDRGRRMISRRKREAVSRSSRPRWRQ